ncbi:unnamed protein product, partial [Laminaria digitata]
MASAYFVRPSHFVRRSFLLRATRFRCYACRQTCVGTVVVRRCRCDKSWIIDEIIIDASMIAIANDCYRIRYHLTEIVFLLARARYTASGTPQPHVFERAARIFDILCALVFLFFSPSFFFL